MKIKFKKNLIILSIIVVIGIILFWSTKTKGCVADRQPGFPPVDELVIVTSPLASKEFAVATAQNLGGTIIYQGNNIYVLKVKSKDINELHSLINKVKSANIIRATTSAYSSPNSSACENASYSVDEVVVGLVDNAGVDSANKLVQSVNGIIIGFSYSTNTYTFKIPASRYAEQDRIIKVLQDNKNVESVSHNVRAGLH